MTSKGQPREHHFVPRGLLRPWATEVAPGQFKLTGFYWDSRSNRLRWKQRGVGGFCFQIDLLTLRGLSTPEKRQALEARFFQAVDDRGLKVRDKLLENGVSALTAEDRSDFGRLLLSLDVRRPRNVSRLRTEASANLADILDNDPEIKEAMARAGVEGTASEFLVKHSGVSFEDRAMLIVQRLVDNPDVGGRLINATWHVRHLGNDCWPLVLSDRPLVRHHGYDRPGATWLLPLTPRAVFIACNDPANVCRLIDVSDHQFVRRMNIDSVAQAERFVFSTDQRHTQFLATHLRPRSSS